MKGLCFLQIKASSPFFAAISRASALSPSLEAPISLEVLFMEWIRIE